MSVTSVFAHVFSLAPRAARVELTEKWGEQLERWVHRGGVTVADVARSLGYRREHLYSLFRGKTPFHAEWLYLLPPAVLKLILDDLASTIGYELRARSEIPEEYDHGQSSADFVRELTDTLRVRSQNEADGQLTPKEILEELSELDEADKAITLRRTFLLHALEQRGGKILHLVDRFTAKGA